MRDYEYAKTNILQSLENCVSYASYLKPINPNDLEDTLREDIEYLFGNVQDKVQKIFEEYETNIKKEK